MTLPLGLAEVYNFKVEACMPREVGNEIDLQGVMAGISSMCEDGVGRNAKARKAAGFGN